MKIGCIGSDRLLDVVLKQKNPGHFNDSLTQSFEDEGCRRRAYFYSIAKAR